MTKRILLALVVLALALAVRMDGPRTVGPYDGAYHWKRIAWIAGSHESGETPPVTHGMTALDFDLDRGFAGAFCPWPPLYDGAMGLLSQIVGLQSIVWIPPTAFAVLASLVAFFLSRGANGHHEVLTGAVAGLTIALAPYLVEVSRIGAIDHHWTEAVLVIAMLAAVLRRSAAGLAAAMVAALFIQTALIVACGIALIAIVLVQRDAHAARAGAFAFAISATIVVLYRVTRPPDYPSNPWFLGWTHAVLLAAAAVACAVASVRSRWLALACGAAVIAPLAGSMLAGAKFFAGDPWLQSIVEFQPVFRDVSRVGTDLANVGGGVIALLLAAALDASNDSRSTKPTVNETVQVVALFAIVYLVLAISSRRFLVPAIPLFAIAGAVAAASRRRALAIAAVALTLVPPVAWNVYAFASSEPGKPDLVASLAEEVRPLPPGRVLAPWHAGHAIDVLGRHAVVIDNFGSMPDAQTFTGANGALLESEPEKLVAWCREHRVRYLALGDPELHLPAAAVCRGLDRSLYDHTPLASRTVWNRLWRGESIAGFRRVSARVWMVDS